MIKTLKTSWWKKLLFLPALALGISGVFLLKQSQKPLEKEKELSEIKTMVRTFEMQPLDVLPRVVAYGVVQPEMSWEAVSEVRGKILKTHSQLKKGSLIPEGALLLEIDSGDYELAIAQKEAQIQKTKAQLEELKVEKENAENLLLLAEQNLSVSREELGRLESLLQKSTISQSARDQQKQAVLTQQQSVQTLKNQLNLIPTRKKVLEAELLVQEKQLESEQLNLKRTKIHLPFAARISDVRAEAAQFVQQGQVLVIADSIGVAEVLAYVPLDRARHLLKPIEDFKPINLNMEELRKHFNISAKVRLNDGRFQIEWDGHFMRTSEAIDTKTRTMGFVIAVEKPYEQARPGIRPPLVKNMFVRVELSGKVRSQEIVIPRSALHQGKFFLVNAQKRLEVRSVEVEFLQGNFAVLKPFQKESTEKKPTGLQPGEQVIVSDLIYVSEGMLLEAVPDLTLKEAIQQETRGLSDLK